VSGYYVSLVGPLLGLYYPLPIPASVPIEKANAGRLRRLWCSLYTKESAQAAAEKYDGTLLPEAFAQRLLQEDIGHELACALEAL